MSEDKLDRGRGDGNVLSFLKGPKPVHVAVICPPGAALTALLNKMGSKNGMFVLMQQIPLEIGKLANMNGQPNLQLFPLLVFAIDKAAFETWMKVKYEETGMYQMQDIMEDRVISR